jgi:hypothetical protein
MRSRKTSASVFPLVFVVTLAGCASQPASAPAAPPAPRPSPTVYFYPQRGQSPEQQDRDRYECYRWAHRQTGFDPSDPGRYGTATVQVVAGPPPGYAVAAGADNGAAARANAQSDAAVIAYRDAMKSCLAARGYSVQ